MAKIGDTEYECHPALEADIAKLQAELAESIFLQTVSASDKRLMAKKIEGFAMECESLRVKLRTIASFDAYDEQSSDNLVYRMQISRIRMVHTRDVHAFVDYIIDCFKTRFHSEIADRISGK